MGERPEQGGCKHKCHVGGLHLVVLPVGHHVGKETDQVAQRSKLGRWDTGQERAVRCNRRLNMLDGQRLHHPAQQRLGKHVERQVPEIVLEQAGHQMLVQHALHQPRLAPRVGRVQLLDCVERRRNPEQPLFLQPLPHEPIHALGHQRRLLVPCLPTHSRILLREKRVVPPNRSHIHLLLHIPSVVVPPPL